LQFKIAGSERSFALLTKMAARQLGGISDTGNNLLVMHSAVRFVVWRNEVAEVSASKLFVTLNTSETRCMKASTLHADFLGRINGLAAPLAFICGGTSPSRFVVGVFGCAGRLRCPSSSRMQSGGTT